MDYQEDNISINKSKTIAIIACSGVGRRMNLDTPKQFLEINNKPIICYTIEKFERCDLVDEIIIVTNKEYIDFVKSYLVENSSYKKITNIVCGGKERIFSVYNGLNSIVNPNSNDVIVIHDGVRPFLRVKDLENIIETTKVKKACVLGVKCKETIKLCKDNSIVRTPIRENLWLAQTPQCFNYKLIKKAYDNAIENKIFATDDSSLVEALGLKVHIIEGHYDNIKITTPEDLKFFNANNPNNYTPNNFYNL